MIHLARNLFKTVEIFKKLQNCWIIQEFACLLCFDWKIFTNLLFFSTTCWFFQQTCCFLNRIVETKSLKQIVETKSLEQNRWNKTIFTTFSTSLKKINKFVEKNNDSVLTICNFSQQFCFNDSVQKTTILFQRFSQQFAIFHNDSSCLENGSEKQSYGICS